MLNGYVILGLIMLMYTIDVLIFVLMLTNVYVIRSLQLFLTLNWQHVDYKRSVTLNQTSNFVEKTKGYFFSYRFILLFIIPENCAFCVT